MLQGLSSLTLFGCRENERDEGEKERKKDSIKFSLFFLTNLEKMRGKKHFIFLSQDRKMDWIKFFP